MTFLRSLHLHLARGLVRHGYPWVPTDQAHGRPRQVGPAYQKTRRPVSGPNRPSWRPTRPPERPSRRFPSGSVKKCAGGCACTCARGCAARREFVNARACVGVVLPAGSVAATRAAAASTGKPRASYDKAAPGDPGDLEKRRLWHAREAYAPERLNRACAPVCVGARWRHGGARFNGEKEPRERRSSWGCARRNDDGGTCKKGFPAWLNGRPHQHKRGGAVACMDMAASAQGSTRDHDSKVGRHKRREGRGAHLRPKGSRR
jgi:hypothetical protein